MEKFLVYKKPVIIAGGFLLFALLLFIYLKPDQAAEPAPLLMGVKEQAESGGEKAEAAEKKIILADVKGAVNKPGVYEAQPGERVINLIEKAGGFKEKADQNQVNLAQEVSDQMVIFVPEIGSAPAAMPGAAGGSVPGGDEKVNINTADEAELMTLTGIGPSKAAAIIEYRTREGGFKKPEDLKNISGIGEKTFEKLKESIKVQ
ncbi:helix-hairpin-helix domain-containing protein [Peribacillus sp. SCS-37]|uniref:helix-hairpin-helix domain-containing protein n=1 Tax=Paraperibacillus esterisolvens TaxID=3115296 RepID=UPI003905E7AE